MPNNHQQIPQAAEQQATLHRQRLPTTETEMASSALLVNTTLVNGKTNQNSQPRRTLCTSWSSHPT
jgi:hypothetical protein